MKIVLLASLCLLSFSAFSSSDKGEKHMEQKMKNMSFEDAKKMNMEIVEKKNENLEKDRSCINEAKEKTDLSKCMKKSWERERETKTSWTQEIKEDYKEAKEDIKKKL